MNSSDFDPGPGPQGMQPPPAIGTAPPKPPLEDLLCRKGPCRHYWEFVTNFEHGNPVGTFEEGEEPRAYLRYCVFVPGDATDLADTAVYSCSEWAPKTEDEIKEIERRQELYQLRKGSK